MSHKNAYQAPLLTTDTQKNQQNDPNFVDNEPFKDYQPNNKQKYKKSSLDVNNNLSPSVSPSHPSHPSNPSNISSISSASKRQPQFQMNIQHQYNPSKPISSYSIRDASESTTMRRSQRSSTSAMYSSYDVYGNPDTHNIIRTQEEINAEIQRNLTHNGITNYPQSLQMIQNQNQNQNNNNNNTTKYIHKIPSNSSDNSNTKQVQIEYLKSSSIHSSLHNNNEYIQNDTSDLTGYATIEERIQKCSWWVWIVVCLCCPILCPFALIWYASTSCIRPRCYFKFTMVISVIWVWIDEITDIMFILWIREVGSVFQFELNGEHQVTFIFYLYISSISFNHLLNVLVSIYIRNHWCFDIGLLKQYQYLYHNVIPNKLKYFFLIFVGTLNAVTFNTICKTYYLTHNKNNVGTIYIEQRFPCSRNISHNNNNNNDDNDNKNNKVSNINSKSSKSERLQKWYNKMYDMESISIKASFTLMLEKEAQIYPLLVLIQFIETIPKLIVYGLIAGWIQSEHTGNHYPFTITKLVITIASLLFQIKACFISCANAEFIEQFNDE